MESSLPPLPRTYDDVTVFQQLEPLRDPFFARDLEQRRLTKTQETEWVARIAKDVQKNERAVRAFFLFGVFPINTAIFPPSRLTQPYAGSRLSRYRQNESIAISFCH
jgi:hypothetical protein